MLSITVYVDVVSRRLRCRVECKFEQMQYINIFCEMWIALVIYTTMQCICKRVFTGTR